jgi:DNA-binding XRE family transcriptional regulator
MADLVVKTAFYVSRQNNLYTTGETMAGILRRTENYEIDLTGEQARQQRQALGLTQQQIADVAGVGVRTLRKVERNEGPTFRTTRECIRGALHRAAAQRARPGRAA